MVMVVVAMVQAAVRPVVVSRPVSVAAPVPFPLVLPRRANSTAVAAVQQRANLLGRQLRLAPRNQAPQPGLTLGAQQ